MNNEERKRALRKRTKEFAGSVVRFFISLDKRREETHIFGKQLLRSGTSVAANYLAREIEQMWFTFMCFIPLRTVNYTPAALVICAAGLPCTTRARFLPQKIEGRLI